MWAKFEEYKGIQDIRGWCYRRVFETTGTSYPMWIRMKGVSLMDVLSNWYHLILIISGRYGKWRKVLKRQMKKTDIKESIMKYGVSDGPDRIMNYRLLNFVHLIWTWHEYLTVSYYSDFLNSRFVTSFKLCIHECYIIGI